MEISKIYKKDKIKITFAIENCLEDYAYALEFKIYHSPDDKELFKTEEVKNKRKNGTINFSKYIIYEYDFSKVKKFELHLKRWGVSKFVNISVKEKYHLCISTIIASKNSVFKTKVKENVDNCETIIISAENPEYSSIEKNFKNFNFFDYLKAGIQFNSFIAIDFSGGSEHVPDLKNNQFLSAIQGFRETIFEFVKSFKVYGYGANYEGLDKEKKFFNLSMEENAELTGLTKITNKYKECLKKIKFEEKGYLSPVYENIQKEIFKQYSPDTYYIIFILINNKPIESDTQNCINFLVESTRLPLSIITILIGDKNDEEKSSIKFLFSNKRKISSNYIERIRNNVSFFTMENCNYNNEILKSKCLREIPEQVLEFYRYNKTSPEDIKKQNLDNIKNSMKEFDPDNSMYLDSNCAPIVGQYQEKAKTEIININKDNIIKNINIDNNKEDKKEIIINIQDKKDDTNDKKGYIITPGFDSINKEDEKEIKIENKKDDNNEKKSYINTPGYENNFKEDEKEIKLEKKNEIKNDNDKGLINTRGGDDIIRENDSMKANSINNIRPEKKSIIGSKGVKYENPFKRKKQNKGYINTPLPDQQDKEMKIIKNPFAKNEEEKEEPKEEKKSEINEIIINQLKNNENYIINQPKYNENNNNEKKYVDETPSGNFYDIKSDNNENYIINQPKSNENNNNEKYVNETPSDNINEIKLDNKKYINPFRKKNSDEKNEINNIGNNNNIDININNNLNDNKFNNNIIFNNQFQKKDNEKIYKNETPGYDNNINNNTIEKKFVINPFQNKKIEKEKKYVNTPGNDNININNNSINNKNKYKSNPFQKKKSEKNEIRDSIEDEKEENLKKESHYQIFEKDLSKLSTNSSHNRNEIYDYAVD